MSNVDHPNHYFGADNQYEVIKVLRVWLTPEELIGFCKGSALKYMARHRQKGGAEDLAKAEWYSHYMNNFIFETGADVGGKKPTIEGTPS